MTRLVGSACRSPCRPACSTPSPCGTGRATRPRPARRSRSAPASCTSPRPRSCSHCTQETTPPSRQVRRRSGSHLDPGLCDVFVGRAPELLDGLDDVDAYEYVLDAEPDPVRLVDDDGLEAVARTFGDLVDLKSPWLHGHSAGVAELAAAAVRNVGLGDDVRCRADRRAPTRPRPRRGVEPDLGQSRARSARPSATRHVCTRTTASGSSPGFRRWPRSRSSPASTTSAATAAGTTAASPRAS